MMNVGYTLAKNDDLGFKWDCYVFHDVDMLIENDYNMYRCINSTNPLHLGVHVDKFNYRQPYSDLVGGALQVNEAMFEGINGYSNLFWGWGGEDDDFAFRMRKFGRYQIMRPTSRVARYKMITHKHDKRNPENKFRWRLLRNWRQRLHSDGVKQIMTNKFKWKIDRRENWHAFERIYIDLGSQEHDMAFLDSVVRTDLEKSVWWFW